MSNYEATKYDFDGSALTGIEGIPTGTIVPWSAAGIATGFLECNGTAVSRTTYAALFAIVSTTYGVGDGATTFNLPDLQDNVAVSKSGTKALATTGGANTVTSTGNVGGSTANATLSTAQLASHTHNAANAGGGHNNNSWAPNNLASGGASGAAGSGTGHAHNMSATFSGDATAVLQPYLTLVYIIKI
jgi:microcystin-dependent protein